MADKLLKILLEFALDKNSSKSTEKGLADIGKGLVKVDQIAKNSSKTWDTLGSDMQSYTAAFDKRFKIIKGSLVDVGSGAKATAKELKDFDPDAIVKVTKSAEQLGREFARDKREVKALNKEISNIAKLMKVSERTIEDASDETYKFGQNALEAKENYKKLNSEAAKLREISTRIQQTSQIGLGAGLGISGAIFGSAKSYISELEQYSELEDAISKRFLDSNAKIKSSFFDIGKVATATVLPVLEKAAELAEKAANFVEDNPDVVKAALNVGLVVATVSAIGLAVSKGIKVFADASTLALSASNFIQAKLVEKTAEKLLAAQLLATKTGGVASAVDPATIKSIMFAAGKSLAKGFGVAIAVGGGVAIGLTIANAINDALGREKQTSEDLGNISKQIIAADVGILLLALEGVGVVSDKTSKDLFETTKNLLGLSDAADAVSESAVSAGDTLTNAEFDKIISSFGDANIASLEKYAQKRLDTISKFDDLVESANASLDSALLKAASNLSKSLSSIETSFSASEATARENHNARVSQIRSRGNQAVEKLARDHKRKMLEIENTHNANVEGFVADRDALGLSRELARYKEEKREKEARNAEEIAEAKQKTQRELAEAARSENLRAAQAKRSYDTQVEAAKIRYKEQVDLAKKQNEERLAVLIEEKAIELAEIKRLQREERIASIKERAEQLKDLNGALSQERELKRRWYTLMQADISSALNEASKFSSYSYSKPRGYASGGYPSQRNINVNEEGQEFILSNKTTRAVEDSLGGKITQENIAKSVAGKSNGSTLNLALPGGLMTISMANKMIQENIAIFKNSLVGELS